MEIIKPLSTEKESLIPSSFISELRSGNVLAWVGAGLSIGVGFPSWTQLVTTIAEEIYNISWDDSINNNQWVIDNANNNPEWVAEVLLKSNKHAFNKTLINIFEKNKDVSSETHFLLSLLPFKGYITTNYDSLIEDHIKHVSLFEPKVYDHKNAVSLLTSNLSEKFVLKIHGDIKTNKENLILSESAYYELLRDDLYNKLLSWVFSKHIILCLGYSLRDRDFRSFIDERFRIFKSNCPPIYAFVPSLQTCKDEINCYKSMYNVNLIPISEQYNYKEISETLLSLYCLYHRIDSSIYGNDLSQLLYKKYDNTWKLNLNPTNESDIINTQKLLCVFKDEINIDEFCSICMENNISISTAHIELIGMLSSTNKIKLVENIDSNKERDIIAHWITNSLAMIPVNDDPRSLSIYYKNIFKKYYNTLSYLLNNHSSWNILINNNVNNLKRIIEFFRQQGLWKEWLTIANNAESHATGDIYLEILRSKLWISFWSRDYEELNILINKYPDNETNLGVNDYKVRLSYMNVLNLDKLKEELEQKLKSNKYDYFDISLLGRTYARMSCLPENEKHSQILLQKAEKHIENALEQAILANDLIEIAVQRWYLALVQIDLNKINEAKIHLAETKRIDVNILERVPGMTWLTVTDYRLAMKENSKETRRLYNVAKIALEKLGMKNIDIFLDKEYFY